MSKVTEKILEDKIVELQKLIEKFDGDKAGFASWAIMEIAVYAGDSYYEIIGIIHDALLECFILEKKSRRKENKWTQFM